MMTLNNSKALFQNIATAHYNLNGFGFGRLFEVNGEIKPGITYRCLWVVPISTVVTDQTVQRTFNVMVLDLVKKDKSNRDEVWSDCEQDLNDVIKILRNESDDYELIGEPELNPIDEAHGDWLAGYGTTLTVQSDFNNNYCDIPSASISSPVAVPGYGIIKDQHGNIVTTLRRGEVYYIEILEEVQQTLGNVTPTIIQVIS
jgi:hypothetical protein